MAEKLTEVGEDGADIKKDDYAIVFNAVDDDFSLFVPRPSEDGTDKEVPDGGAILTAVFMRLHKDENFADEMLTWLDGMIEKDAD